MASECTGAGPSAWLETITAAPGRGCPEPAPGVPECSAAAASTECMAKAPLEYTATVPSTAPMATVPSECTASAAAGPTPGCMPSPALGVGPSMHTTVQTAPE